MTAAPFLSSFPPWVPEQHPQKEMSCCLWSGGRAQGSARLPWRGTANLAGERGLPNSKIALIALWKKKIPSLNLGMSGAQSTGRPYPKVCSSSPSTLGLKMPPVPHSPLILLRLTTHPYMRRGLPTSRPADTSNYSGPDTSPGHLHLSPVSASSSDLSAALNLLTSLKSCLTFLSVWSSAPCLCWLTGINSVL